MKKLLSILLCFAMLFALTACSKETEKEEPSNAQKVETLLNDGKFEEAYKAAESDELKTQALAENLLSCYCYNTNKNTETDLKLLEGYFGQVEASENDKYVPTSDVLAIDNYAKLAKYIATLRGEDVLADYYYGIVKVLVGDEVEAYGFVSLSKKDSTYNSIISWTSLDADSDDSTLEALYKYVGQKLIEDGAQISDKAVERINKKYLSDSPEEIEFEIKL